MADHELVGDDERDKFAGTSAVRERDDDQPAPLRDDQPMHEPAKSDYEQGRRDEAEAESGGRFSRESETADEPRHGHAAARLLTL